MSPLADAMLERRETADIVRAHIAAAENLAETAGEKGAGRLWKEEAGEAAANFIRELMDAAPAFGDIDPRTYARLFDELLGGRVLRPRWGLHPRLFIWGPLEARLQHADRMILGGLNEGKWPSRSEYRSLAQQADAGRHGPRATGTSHRPCRA